jgi:hypothetical protein
VKGCLALSHLLKIHAPPSNRQCRRAKLNSATQD